jgi:DNA-directed RNA polymerase specialized sigma24 family protein
MSIDVHHHTTMNYAMLISLKDEGKQAEFNKQLLKVIPEVEKYIARSLIAAVREGFLDERTITVEDVIDQVYIKAYEHLSELKDPELFEAWLKLQAEEVLQEYMDDQEFDHLFFTDLEQYTSKEWKEMEEQYSIDADGDLMMLEEFDDPAYGTSDMTDGQIFSVETEQELNAKIDKDISAERKQRHMELVLGKLSLPMRTIFELEIRNGCSPMEIARLRNMELHEVESQLKTTRDILRRSLLGRFRS